MPLIDVTYDETVGEEVLHRLAEVLPDAVAEAVDCPEEPWIGPPGPGDIEIRFRKKAQLDVGGLDVVIEVRTKLFEHRVQDKQRRADLIRDRISSLPLGQAGVWLILSEGAWSQSRYPQSVSPKIGATRRAGAERFAIHPPVAEWLASRLASSFGRLSATERTSGRLSCASQAPGQAWQPPVTMTADRHNYGGSTMVTPNPGAEGVGASPPQPLPPESAERTPGTGGPAPGPGDGRPTAPGTRQRHPAILEVEQQRVQNVQLRVADRITAFAGSMNFVYLHVLLFAVWMLLIEKSPWPTLTLIVSLEAIFLSTFVMIGQNRQAAFQQAKADHDFTEQELELKTNTQLTREIHTLTAELYKRSMENPAREQS